MQPAHVLIDDGVAVLHQFRETDPLVVEIIREAGDKETAVHQLLGIGARSVRMTRTTMDVDLLETACRDLFEGFQKALASRFDGQESSVAHVLNDFRGQLEELLAKAFDPDSRRSIIGRFDGLVREIRKDEHERMRQLLDVADERSPLHRLGRELTEAVHREAMDLREIVAQAQRTMAVHAAEEVLLEETSIKGRLFEDILHDAVCR